MKHVFGYVILAAVSILPFHNCIAADLDSMAVRIAHASPSLASLKASNEARTAGERADNVLAGPEIEGEYKFAPKGVDNRWSAGISQSFDWPGVYAARRTAADFREQAFGAMYRAELISRTQEAKAALIELASACRRLDILTQMAANVDSLDNVYKRAYSRGDATILDVKKFELQHFEMDNRLVRCHAEVAAARAAVDALAAGVVPADYIPALPAVAAPSTLAAYIESWRANDPALQAGSAMESAAMADISAARRMALPSFRVGYVHDYEDATHFNGISVSISLPTWSPSARIAAARRSAVAVASESTDYAIRAGAAVEAAYVSASELYNRLESAGDVAADYPQLLGKALVGGAINLFTFFEEYNEWLSAQIDIVDLQRQYALAISELGRYTSAL